ncbi:MAG: phage minor head protein [Bacteroidales bacterium]|nr:phage minor head protein [Bacteroidales bacterium]
MGSLKSYNRFQQDVLKLHQAYNVNYLQAEYNYAASAAQMAAKWNDFEQDGDQYDLQYRTAADEKVRESHYALHNTTLPPSDPFWNEYMPPLDWNCRCTVVQVRKGKYPRSNNAEAVNKGQIATTRLDKNGVNRTAMFRFNPGKQKVIFPEKHPYFKVQQGVKDIVNALINQGEWEDIPVSSGSVKVSPLHGKKERKNNIAIASYYSEKYSFDYKLLPVSLSHRTADALNETLNIKQEFKLNNTPTKSAIDNALRRAKGQASNIVIQINSDISAGDLTDAIKNRVRRSSGISEIWIKRGDFDAMYPRKDILVDSFKIQWD